MKQLTHFVDKYHWLWLLLAAPFLVLPSPVRSLALLVVPVLWILGLWEKRIQNIKYKIENAASITEDLTDESTGLVFDSGFPVTPLNVSLLVLVIMVLVSLWATYSIEQSLEKISGLVLGLGVFFAVVRESRKTWGWRLSLAAFVGGGVGWATLGFLGMNYQVRFSFLAPVISRIPVIIKDLPGADSGLQHNAVGGTLLWIFPLLLSLSWFVLAIKGNRFQCLVLGIVGSDVKQTDSKQALIQRFSGRFRRAVKYKGMIWMLRFMLWITTLFVGIVLMLTQSRGSYLALGLTALVILFLVVPKRRRWILLTLIILSVLGASIFIFQAGGWKELFVLIGFSGEEGLSIDSLGARLEIWSRAIYGIQDFSFTGMGMNTFREVVHVLYPLFTISPGFDIAHAHNEFLQVALDLGIPGLIAFISIYIVSFWMLVKIWQTPSGEETSPKTSKGQTPLIVFQDPVLKKALVLGLGGGLFGHLIFGMMDAITLGAKPGIFYWLLLGLIVGLYNRIEDIKLAN